MQILFHVNQSTDIFLRSNIRKMPKFMNKFTSILTRKVWKWMKWFWWEVYPIVLMESAWNHCKPSIYSKLSPPGLNSIKLSCDWPQTITWTFNLYGISYNPWNSYNPCLFYSASTPIYASLPSEYILFIFPQISSFMP